MVFIIAAVLVAAGALLFTLLIRDKDIPEAPPPSPTAHLEERKAQIYENLRDLQFEYRTGKLSDADYQATKTGLQRELAHVLAEIDAIRQQQPQPAVKAAAAGPEANGATSKKRAVETSKACPHCGAHFAQSLRFCGECGKPMIA
jgi:NADH pyrophosphatase NudC (nudix superfamily)